MIIYNESATWCDGAGSNAAYKRGQTCDVGTTLSKGVGVQRSTSPQHQRATAAAAPLRKLTLQNRRFLQRLGVKLKRQRK